MQGGSGKRALTRADRCGIVGAVAFAVVSLLLILWAAPRDPARRHAAVPSGAAEGAR